MLGALSRLQSFFVFSSLYHFSFFFFCIPYLNSMTDVKPQSIQSFSSQNSILHLHSRNLFLAKTIAEASLIKNSFFIVVFKTLHFEGVFIYHLFIRQHKIYCISLACFNINQPPKKFLQLFTLSGLVHL